jgi:hypothetical protein
MKYKIRFLPSWQREKLTCVTYAENIDDAIKQFKSENKNCEILSINKEDE